jgi:hypothetical protein
MTLLTRHFASLFVAAVCLVGPHALQAQHHRAGGADSSAVRTPHTTLHAPGESVFGAVQEALRRLEADPNTDWSAVDVDALRQHLIDMHHVAMHVAVERKAPVDGGLRLRVRPTTEAARASLDRVLSAHPSMLKQETGWTMDVETDGASYVLRVTTEDTAEVAKLRALGYMGLLAYGQHHQRHHWHLVRGQNPHGHHAH